MTSKANESTTKIIKDRLFVTRSELMRLLKTKHPDDKLHTAFVLEVERTKYKDGKVTLSLPYEQRYL